MAYASQHALFGKFHELQRKSKFVYPPSGNFRRSKKQKSGKCHELPRKVIKCNPHPTPPGVGSFMGKNVKCLRHFMNCLENLYFLLAPAPTPSDGGGGFGAKI